MKGQRFVPALPPGEYCGTANWFKTIFSEPVSFCDTGAFEAMASVWTSVCQFVNSNSSETTVPIDTFNMSNFH